MSNSIEVTLSKAQVRNLANGKTATIKDSKAQSTTVVEITFIDTKKYKKVLSNLNKGKGTRITEADLADIVPISGGKGFMDFVHDVRSGLSRAGKTINRGMTKVTNQTVNNISRQMRKSGADKILKNVGIDSAKIVGRLGAMGAAAYMTGGNPQAMQASGEVADSVINRVGGSFTPAGGSLVDRLARSSGGSVKSDFRKMSRGIKQSTRVVKKAFHDVSNAGKSKTGRQVMNHVRDVGRAIQPIAKEMGKHLAANIKNNLKDAIVENVKDGYYADNLNTMIDTGASTQGLGLMRSSIRRMKKGGALDDDLGVQAMTQFLGPGGKIGVRSFANPKERMAYVRAFKAGGSFKEF